MSTLVPRLELGALAPALADALRPRVERLGYLGEFFQCAGHQPQALLSFMAFTDALKEALPDNVTEVVALTVAARMGNDYERHQHEQLCRRLGFADQWIREIVSLRPDESPALQEPERLIQQLA